MKAHIETLHKALHPSNHKPKIIGLVLMVGGSSLAKFGPDLIPGGALIHVSIDMVAYAVHGAGTVPFVYHLIHWLALEPKETKVARRVRARKGAAKARKEHAATLAD